MFFAGSVASLFSIVNPLMAAPVFISLTEGQTPDERTQVAAHTAQNVFGVLGAFFIAGSLILAFFGISIHALRIAGGLMILNSSFGMLNKKERLLPEEQLEAKSREDIAFSPMAMPVLSGPGAIAVLLGMSSEVKVWSDYLLIFGAIAVVSYATYWVLRLAGPLIHKLGPTLMKAFTRIMGFLLLCVGVQFIVNGVNPLIKEAIAAAIKLTKGA